MKDKINIKPLLDSLLEESKSLKKCVTCDGVGEIVGLRLRFNLFGTTNNEPVYTTFTCGVCDGTGMLKKWEFNPLDKRTNEEKPEESGED